MERDFCSRGRWPPQHRNLPDDPTAKKLTGVLMSGFKKCEKIWITKDKTHDAKRVLMCLAAGKMEGFPFDQGVVAEVRSGLRLVCKKAGLGDGLPREGDIFQAYGVRLIQPLLAAFADRDSGGQPASGWAPQTLDPQVSHVCGWQRNLGRVLR